ncbi:hypothetical protein [Paenibacillus sp. R14(2021)]|uniref:hypothetical protein n=1 Tax=Paenibacillus sp. R14(2021) TaxID=2859228 RepID=UPI001C616255|nr:hypothetical protein [Paenibacillus sp. R14(2021)]
MAQRSDTVSIAYIGFQPIMYAPADMARLAGRFFPLSDRIEGGAGEAFDFGDWFANWRIQLGIDGNQPMPTHLKVEAADAFEALIPWEQLEHAAIQFAMDGGPLPKGGPIRLYVPNGSSECLNVKSVVVFRFLLEEGRRGEVSYGFKQTFSPDDMRLRR